MLKKAVLPILLYACCLMWLETSAAAEPVCYDQEYKLPGPIQAYLLKEEAEVVMLPGTRRGEELVIEVVNIEPTGFITTLFVISHKHRLCLIGLFVYTGTKITACDIAQAIATNLEGQVIFLWNKNQKES